MRTVHVIQGEYKVSDDPEIVLTTILGSCVSMCLSDPVMRVGGMNHFLLPEGDNEPAMGERYGLMAMELLVNGLLKLGARKDRMEAKLFGGAILNANLARIGDANAAFARKFLSAEGITCRSSSLGGNQARRIRYVPTTGAAQQMMLADHSDPVQPAARPKVPPPSDDIELF